jgi:DUF1009 family protein
MNANGTDTESTLGIICGGGSLPFSVADAVLARGRNVALFPLEGIADETRVKSYPHHWIALAQIGALIAGLRKEKCRDIVFIGSLVRPRLSKIRFDFQTLLMLPRLVAAMRGGDDHLLSRVAGIAERYGFRVVAAQDVAPEVLVGEGTLTRRKPQASDVADIMRGLSLLNAIGPYDVGQGAVVAGQHVLAVEGVEGTDAMLARIADLRREGKLAAGAGSGVLVKAPKPRQDRRIDMPAIGPATVRAVSEAGLAGIAVAAGSTLLAEPDATIEAANKADIFVTGARAPEP